MALRTARMTLEVRAVAELSPDEQAAPFDWDAGVESAYADAREIVERVGPEGDIAFHAEKPGSLLPEGLRDTLE